MCVQFTIGMINPPRQSVFNNTAGATTNPIEVVSTTL